MRILFYFTSMLLAFHVSAQQKNRIFIENDGRPNLIGQFEAKELKKEPFKKWFKENAVYLPEEKEFNLLLSNIERTDSITIFMGTWCGDSKREVPKVLTLLEKLNFDKDKIKLIGVNRGINNYKQSPGHEEQGQNIHRVPTIIFHDKEGNEINRIVESPKESLEKDMNQLLSGSYEPNYLVVADLQRQFSKIGGLQYVIDNLETLAEQYRNIIENKYELIAYGYILISTYQVINAEVVFYLNTLIYPDEASTYVALAWSKRILSKKDEAIESIRKAITLAPDNAEYAELMQSIAEIR